MTLVINWEIVTINLTNIIINKSNECAKQIGYSAGREIKISDSRKNLSASFDTKDFRTSSESLYCFQTLCNYVREQQLWQFKKYRPIYLIFLCMSVLPLARFWTCKCVCVCMELSNKYCFSDCVFTVKKSSLTWIIARIDVIYYYDLCLHSSSREFTASQFKQELKECAGFIPRYN
jgi:hypothetical protein